MRTSLLCYSTSLILWSWDWSSCCNFLLDESTVGRFDIGGDSSPLVIPPISISRLQSEVWRLSHTRAPESSSFVISFAVSYPSNLQSRINPNLLEMTFSWWEVQGHPISSNLPDICPPIQELNSQKAPQLGMSIHCRPSGVSFCRRKQMKIRVTELGFEVMNSSGTSNQNLAGFLSRDRTCDNQETRSHGRPYCCCWIYFLTCQGLFSFCC